LSESRAFDFTQHHQRRGPGIGKHAVGGDHGDGGERVAQRAPVAGFMVCA
jgi:hypothetical protein